MQNRLPDCSSVCMNEREIKISLNMFEYGGQSRTSRSFWWEQIDFFGCCFAVACSLWLAELLLVTKCSTGLGKQTNTQKVRLVGSHPGSPVRQPITWTTVSTSMHMNPNTIKNDWYIKKSNTTQPSKQNNHKNPIIMCRFKVNPEPTELIKDKQTKRGTKNNNTNNVVQCCQVHFSEPSAFCWEPLGPKYCMIPIACMDPEGWLVFDCFVELFGWLLFFCEWFAQLWLLFVLVWFVCTVKRGKRKKQNGKKDHLITGNRSNGGGRLVGRSVECNITLNWIPCTIESNARLVDDIHSTLDSKHSWPEQAEHARVNWITCLLLSSSSFCCCCCLLAWPSYGLGKSVGQWKTERLATETNEKKNLGEILATFSSLIWNQKVILEWLILGNWQQKKNEFFVASPKLWIQGTRKL